VPDHVVQAIRAGRPIVDYKLEALRRFTAAVVTMRGWPSEADTRGFLDAGYTRAQILEVVLGVGMKTLSNYTNHIADTPLDHAFAKAAWSKAA
jgi:alkylhydroperoxidase family enzyme